jgi:hypothetical protein
MKSAVLVSVLALAAFAVLEETALARSYLSCLAKKVVIVDAPKGTTSSSAEENFGFWSSTMKDGVATTIIGAGRCTAAIAPAR